jgi:hypothetical protein
LQLKNKITFAIYDSAQKHCYMENQLFSFFDNLTKFLKCLNSV